jgi:NADP-dependent alcohol dehydrogenase
MNNFIFHNPTRILFGAEQIAAIDQEIPLDARVLVTYGGGSVKKNGVLSQVRSALGARVVFEFGGIEPNPAYETLSEAVSLARREKVDYILALGGGSVIDGSKFIAAALCYQGDDWEIVKSRGAVITAAVPLGCVLTLPATGSEMNCGAVISRKASGDKLAFRHPAVQPRFSVLDPAVCLSLPTKQTANGVVDAFVHTAEQYLTYPVDARVQDRFAEGLMLTLIEEGPQVLAQPDNLAVRANIMWAATMALNGLIGSGVPQDWSTHMLGHELTALHGLDHGQTLAIILPAMLQEMRAAKHEKLLQFAERVWHLTEGNEEQRIDGAIAATRDFFERMGLPTHLSAYGIDSSSVAVLVERLAAHGMTALGEKRAVTLEVSKRVYLSAL